MGDRRGTRKALERWEGHWRRWWKTCYVCSILTEIKLSYETVEIVMFEEFW